MLRKKKQKTKRGLSGALIFYWQGFLILGRFWKMYFGFFLFFFLDWNDFNVFFVLWLGRYFCQLHLFFFYFNGLFFFPLRWQEDYYVLEHKSKTRLHLYHWHVFQQSLQIFLKHLLIFMLSMLFPTRLSVPPRIDFPGAQILLKSLIKTHPQGQLLCAPLPGMVTQYLGKNTGIIEEFRC